MTWPQVALCYLILNFYMYFVFHGPCRAVHAAHLAWPCPAPVHRFLQLAHGGVQRRVVRLIAELQLCSRVEGQPKASACTPDRVMPERTGVVTSVSWQCICRAERHCFDSALWPCGVWQGLQQPGAEPEVLWECATQLWAHQRALHSAPRLRTTNEILHVGLVHIKDWMFDSMTVWRGTLHPGAKPTLLLWKCADGGRGSEALEAVSWLSAVPAQPREASPAPRSLRPCQAASGPGAKLSAAAPAPLCGCHAGPGPRRKPSWKCAPADQACSSSAETSQACVHAPAYCL